MVSLLDPLVECDRPPRLQFLFFANTFPLIYHYALALFYKRHPVSEYIHWGTWGDVTTAGNSPMIYYSNYITSQQACAPVTLFKPTYVFTPLSLTTSHIIKNLKSKDVHNDSGLSLERFLSAARNYFSELHIMSEIHDLGLFVSDISSNYFKNIQVLSMSNDFSSNPHVYIPGLNNFPGADILRLFVYGGSLSSYLKRKNKRYLCLGVTDRRNGADRNSLAKLQTFIVAPVPYIDALSAYHDTLYSAAKRCMQPNNFENNKCQPFTSVYRCYNEISLLLQHRSSFNDFYEFAQCLDEHHSKSI